MRAVLDTNAIVSALIFGGLLAPIRTSLANHRLVPLLCDATMAELVRVLTYPKFRLSTVEREALLHQLFSNAEIWPSPTLDPRFSTICRDRDDAIFLALASDAGVPLVSGDRDLTALRGQSLVTVLSPAELVALLA